MEYTGIKLFAGVAPDEIGGLLGCLGARRAYYSSGDMIIEEGGEASEFGILLSGRARAVKWDAAGRLIIIAMIEKGGEIGVMLAANPNYKSPVSVQAQCDAEVLRIPYARLLARCPNSCPRHQRALENYVGIVAEKGLMLHERMDCLLKSALREKILTYLARVSRERRSLTFQIPMNRNAMAEYLNAERSALSRELSNMKRDGLIDYHKNCFKLARLTSRFK